MMEMGELKFRGEPYTWANNRESECFIQKRLDGFFGSQEWMLHWNTTEVKHIARQASDIPC